MHGVQKVDPTPMPGFTTARLLRKARNGRCLGAPAEYLRPREFVERRCAGGRSADSARSANALEIGRATWSITTRRQESSSPANFRRARGGHTCRVRPGRLPAGRRAPARLHAPAGVSDTYVEQALAAVSRRIAEAEGLMPGPRSPPCGKGPPASRPGRSPVPHALPAAQLGHRRRAGRSHRLRARPGPLPGSATITRLPRRGTNGRST